MINLVQPCINQVLIFMSKFKDYQQNLNHTSFDTALTYSDSDSINFTFKPQIIFKYIIVVISCLVTFDLIGKFYQYVLNGERASDIIQLFNLDSEANIPSTYSSFALLLCSFLLAIIAKRKHQGKNHYRLHWKFLALIFLCLAINEGAGIHEISVGKTRSLLHTDGFFYYAWVIPAMILFSLFALAYLKFVLSLPKKTRSLFVLCAAIFITGAIGVEMICGQIVTLQGNDNLTYALVAMAEETLEMVAIAIFVYALSDYIKKNIKPVMLRFQDRVSHQ